MMEQLPDESWDSWYERTKVGRRAGQDQGVAMIREKIDRLLPDLAADPTKARVRLTLILRAAMVEAGGEAVCEVLADYVIRLRDGE